MKRDFTQIDWNASVEQDCRQVIRLAMAEDLNGQVDLTTAALVPEGAKGAAALVAREKGVVAGLRAAEVVLDEFGANLTWQAVAADGEVIEAGATLAQLSGDLSDLLTTERIVLNLLGRLSGIATLTATYVAAVQSTKARIYDTRKTTPGWRRLEKYAVRMGGGHNHRTGLFDAVLIKDNHLASQASRQGAQFRLAEVVPQVRTFLAESSASSDQSDPLIEIEVDTLEQLSQVLASGPQVVLLDNMAPAELRQAITLRDRLASQVELEASGGISLETVAEVAATGVDRISVGNLTHAACSLDIGLDWSD